MGLHQPGRDVDELTGFAIPLFVDPRRHTGARAAEDIDTAFQHCEARLHRSHPSVFHGEHLVANGEATDLLSIQNHGVTDGGDRIGTFRGGVGTAALTIDLNDKATVATVEGLIQNITSPDTADVRFTMNDGDGGTSVTRVRTVKFATIADHAHRLSSPI